MLNNFFFSTFGFIVTLGLLVIVHEWGHYQVARWCGVRVLRFSVGFGSVLWRRQNHPGATEFTLSALPLGGYVRFLDSREDLVSPSERAMAFDAQPLRKRAAIVAAGPVLNLLLAVLLYTVVAWSGKKEPQAVLATPPAGSLAADAGLVAGDRVLASRSAGSDEWRDVVSFADLIQTLGQTAVEGQSLHLLVGKEDGRKRQEVLLERAHLGEGAELNLKTMARVGLRGGYAEPVMGNIKPGGAAQQAGLQKGDLVLAVDEQIVPDAAWLRDRIRAHIDAPAPMRWAVERAGQRLTLQVSPKLAHEGETRIGKVEAYIGALPPTVVVSYGFADGLERGVARTVEMASFSLKMLGRMLVGEASLKNLSGPLSIAEGAGQSVQRGLSDYLEFLALVSLSLGVLNLLPLPLLDGGHLMYYLFEGLTGRPVSDDWLKWLQRGGALALLLMMSIALSNDLVRLFGPP
ncbi:MAG: RIP metalloprotease RseP [Ideonella sp. MAG2]|nr:MAG: RIP metalloprotease RseP [Ideonella sp. MAG2]